MDAVDSLQSLLILSLLHFNGIPWFTAFDLSPEL